MVGVSCKKNNNLLGGNVIGQDQLLNSGGVDTFQLQTYTISEDSVLSNSPRNSLLGAYNDPEFGTFKSGFYTQIRLSGLNPNFGSNPLDIVVDSFILALEFNGSYGPASTQTFEVYRVNERMYLDSNYYQFSTLSTETENIVNPGFGTKKMDPKAITVVGNDTVRTQLRIPLKTAKAQEIINDAIGSVYDAEFGNDDLFVNNYYNGIYVTTNGVAATNGGVGYFNLLDQDSKLIIYYKNAGVSQVFDFRINEQCAHFNHVEVNNSGKFVQTVIDDTISGMKEFYAQAYQSRAVIDFPTLKNLPSNVVVHSAILYLPVQYQQFTSFAPSGTVSVLTAKTFSIITTGTYNAISREYAIDLRNFIQAFTVGGVSSPEIVISPASFISTADRIVFNGPNSTNKKKPRLVLTYTEF
jgi:hypothetical protein